MSNTKVVVTGFITVFSLVMQIMSFLSIFMAKVSLKFNVWVGQIAVGINCIKVWDNIIMQIGVFFHNGFLTIRGDPLFKICNWSKEEIKLFFTLLRCILKFSTVYIINIKRSSIISAESRT